VNFSTSLKVGARIEGVGVVGGFGSGARELASAMKRGEPAGEIISVSHPHPHLDTDADADAAPCRALRADTAGLERFIPKRALRRIDHYSRMALLGAHLALEDAGVDLAAPLGERVALVVASGHGAVGSTFSFLDSMIEDGDAYSSPTHFSNSVHNAAAAHISMRLGITGPNLTVSQQTQSVTSALAGALGYLAGGDADAVLFGAVDEVSPVYSFGSDALHGEGAAFFWLVRGDEGNSARRDTGARYGEVELLRVDEGAPRDVVVDFDLLFGDGAGDGVGEDIQLIDTAPVLGEFPTRAALDLALCALGAAKDAKRRGVIERQGESCAVARVYPG
jgi:3-oxoacyl-[acyl-carrier-protein] synthase II